MYVCIYLCTHIKFLAEVHFSFVTYKFSVLIAGFTEYIVAWYRISPYLEKQIHLPSSVFKKTNILCVTEAITLLPSGTLADGPGKGACILLQESRVGNLSVVELSLRLGLLPDLFPVHTGVMSPVRVVTGTQDDPCSVWFDWPGDAGLLRMWSTGSHVWLVPWDSQWHSLELVMVLSHICVTHANSTMNKTI